MIPLTRNLTLFVAPIMTFHENITGVQSTLANNHLFQIQSPNEARPLPKEQARIYHHVTAQLLFLSRVRHVIQTTIAFLTIGVKQPDEDD